MKSNGAYELHLTVRETSLSAGMEWPASHSNWLMLQVESGNGYWMHSRQNSQLEPGTVLLLPPDSESSLRASQMSGLSFCFFCVDPMRLMGLMTLAEQTFFRMTAARQDFIARILPPPHPLAAQLRDLFAERKQAGSLLRLQLLQKFIEVFGNDLTSQETVEPDLTANAKQRLSDFLKTTQTSELINLSFTELVHVSRCTPRHLSRIFREITGMSFRNKRAELRLAQACDLLALTELKIVDVALESGFQSLSLFNLMFARRFGMSPGRWRKKNREAKTVLRPTRRPAPTLAPAL